MLPVGCFHTFYKKLFFVLDYDSREIDPHEKIVEVVEKVEKLFKSLKHLSTHFSSCNFKILSRINFQKYNAIGKKKFGAQFFGCPRLQNVDYKYRLQIYFHRLQILIKIDPFSAPTLMTITLYSRLYD